MTPSTLPRVLIVEDDLGTRTAIERFLSASGFAVSVARTGDDALALAQTLDFEAMVLDLRIPYLGGTELLARVRALPGPRGKVAVVVTTGVPEASVPQAQRTMQKPVELEKLRAVLLQLVGRKGA